MSQPVAPPGVTFANPAEGAVGPLLWAHDWSQTSLGPLETWPRTLVGYVRMMLRLPVPAIIFWGADLIQLYNDGYAVIMGPRHPRHLGSPYRECWPDTYPTIHPWMERVVNHGEIVEVERTLIPLTRHGYVEEAWFTFSFSPLHDDQGSIAGLLQPVREVTSVVLAERRLRTLQALASYRQGSATHWLAEALAENPHDVRCALLCTESPEGFRVDARSGLPPSAGPAGLVPVLEAVLRSGRFTEVEDLQAVLPHEPSAPWPEPTRRALVLPVLGTGVLVVGLSPRLPFDESYRAFVEGVAREVAGLLQAEQDELARLRSERELEAARVRFELAARATRDVIWDWDLVTNQAIWNEALCTEYGYPSEVLRGDASWWYEHLHPEDRERVVHGIHAAIDAQQTNWHDEYRFLAADGSYRDILDRGYVVRDESRPVRMLGAMQDITSLKSALQARDEFLTIASHELKTPLTPLRLQLQRLARFQQRGERPTDEQLSALLARADKQVGRLALLVDDLLDVTRISTGRLSLKCETLNLEQLVRDVVERHAEQARHAGCGLMVSTEGRLELAGDGLRLEQVLVNLLSNALKYAPGTPIHVRAAAGPGHLRLEVRDGGDGVPPEDRERIFGRFERADSHSAVRGLGLGLYISKKIVEAHKGRIWVEDSTFVVELPA